MAALVAGRAKWLRLMPVVFVTYSFAYIDRANYAFGAAGGLAQDLHITGAAASLLGALFFLGYFLFQIPGARYAQNRSAKKLVFVSMLAWGALAAATGLLTNLTLLFIDRFLLGVVESAILPALLILLSHWFSRAERSRANTVLILGNPITLLWMSVVSGYLVHWLGWRGMFIAEGVPSIVWAAIWWKLVQDGPAQAAWLAGPDRAAIEQTLAEEQGGLPQVRNYRAAFRTRAVILLALVYLFWSIGIYGFILWLPSMLKHGSSMGIVGIGWLSAAPYSAAAILMVAVSAVSDRTLRRKGITWPFLMLGAAGLYASFGLGTGHYWTSFALLTVAGAAMYAPYGPFFALITELLPQNVAGGAIALINSCGALGSFLGTYLVGFLDSSTGGNAASYAFMASCLALGGLLMFAVREPG